ncbi:MAG TPA: saccharopine dehydrogenase family protein [Candidatus Acidoferrales bacterium]|nr:saccharopine dehydrogenase family protein [Candidatus Acidoferrales bacterium]
MKVLVLGSGNIGSTAAGDMAKNMSSSDIVIADQDSRRAKDVAGRIGESNVSWVHLDVANRGQLLSTLKDCDLAMGFLPGNLGYSLMEACIEARKDLVDVSYMAENPFRLHQAATSAGIIIVPDCGLAPGISNFIVGHAFRKLDKTKAVHVMVGGLPKKPIPPLGYIVTWSPESLIDEYTRKAIIVKRGRRVQVEALSGLENVEFPEVGKLEAFFTDGLRTLLYTMDGVGDMWEKTLRYPGHAEKVRLLEAMGLFEEEKIKVEGEEVSPRKLAVKLFEQTLRKPEVKDFVALKVEVCGVKNGEEMDYTYHMLDNCDEKRGVTAMARTTAYPMSIVAQLILSGAIKEKGVVPPERLGMEDRVFRMFWESLKKRGIRISEKRMSC